MTYQSSVAAAVGRRSTSCSIAPRQDRSQFVFTETRGRSMIFWQTGAVAMKANPGGRVPQRRALVAGFTIHIDTREKYAFRFAGRDVAIEHTALEAGDYGVREGDHWLAVVERKSMEDLIGSLSNGTLAYQLAAMAALPTHPASLAPSTRLGLPSEAGVRHRRSGLRRLRRRDAHPRHSPRG